MRRGLLFAGLLWAQIASAQFPVPTHSVSSTMPNPHSVSMQAGEIRTIDVKAYGAVPDASYDSTSAIQAALTEVAETRHRVFVPAGPRCYKITSPLLIHSDKPLFLEGEHRGYGDTNQTGACLQASGYIGPVLHVRGRTAPTAINTAPSLVRGPGTALAWGLRIANDTFLDLVDAGPSAVLNGLPQLSIELFLEISDYNTDSEAQVFESRGGLVNGATTAAFSIRTDTTGHIIGCINVAGTCTDMTSAGVLALNTVYQIELSYDGRAVRMFYGTPGAPSTQAGSTVTASGTVSQSLFETMSIGGQRQNWPHGDLEHGPPAGAIDSIRLSNIARHAGTYTVPTIKYTSDPNTLLLENFDRETADFSVIYTAAGPAYINKRGGTNGQTSGFELAHLMIATSGSGLYLTGVIDSTIRDTTFLGGIYGIDTNNDTFLNRFERLGLVGNAVQSRIGLANVSQSGICSYNDLDFTAWPVGLLSRSGGGAITSGYFHGGQAVTHMVLREGSWTLTSVAFSNEDANPSNFISDVLLDRVESVVLNNVGFEHFVSPTALAIQVNAGHSIIVNGGTFTPHAGATKVVDVLRAPSRPVIVQNAYKTRSAVPWTTSGWVRVTPSVVDTAPAIASGFGGSSAFAGGTSAFTVNVGTGGSASSGVIAMPPAVTGWICRVNNLTAAAGHRADNTRQTASTSTSVTIENQTTSSGAAVAWTNSDVVHLSCEPF